MAFVAVPYFIYASNESKSVLARDLGDCRDNLRNSRSVFLIVDGKIMKNWEGTSDYGKHMENISHQDLVSNQRNVYNVIYETNYRTWRKSYMDLTKLTAYEIIEHRPLPDLKSEGALLRHKKSGARVLLISNDDENKVFNIGFRTPTTNSTGVPHIMEHTVLCGSEKFPTKDPFVELVKGSLNTFLNAMTYPDKTVYPVASCNEKDFQNLMDVYMDAVLHPNIYKHEEIFRQ